VSEPHVPLQELGVPDGFGVGVGVEVGVLVLLVMAKASGLHDSVIGVEVGVGVEVELLPQSVKLVVQIWLLLQQ